MKEKREKILPKAHSAKFFLYCNVVQIILLSVSAEYYITLNITVTSSGLQLCELFILAAVSLHFIKVEFRQITRV